MLRLLILMCTVNCIICCSPRTFSDYPKHIDVNPTGEYSFSKPLEMRCDKPYIPSTFTRSSMHQVKCSYNFPPGIEIMQYGYTKQVEEENVPRQPIIIFGCEENPKSILEGKNYEMPKNTDFQEINDVAYTLSVYDQEETARKWLSTESRSVLEYAGAQMMFYSNIIQKTSERKKKVLRVEFRVYSASPSYQPSKGLLLSYRSLPEKLADDITAYIEFVTTYGLYVRSNVVFGGFLEVVAEKGISDSISKEEKVILINNMLKQDMTRFYFGGENRKNISSWLESVTANPKPIETNLIALYDFIEPNSTSERKHSLKSIVEITENRATLQLLKHFLEWQGPSHQISTFLLNSVNWQLSLMCPSTSYASQIRKGIFQAKNLRFKKYVLFCMHDVSYWTERGDYYVKSIVVSIFPGLCFTKDEAIGYCVRSRIDIPPESPCVLLYESEKCNGHVYANITSSTSNSVLQEALKSTRSFTYC